MKKFMSFFMCLLFSVVVGGIIGSAADIPFIFPAAGLMLASYTLPLGVAGFNLSQLSTAYGDSVEDVPENMGGFNQVGYLIHVNDVDTEPTYPTLKDSGSSVDFDKLAVAVGNIVPKTSKYFTKIIFPKGKTGFNPESQGEAAGSKSFNLSGQFAIPGVTNANSAALARYLNNGQFILILVNPDGDRVQIGTINLPCEISPKGSSGMVGTDENFYTCEYKADSFAPGWKYNGSIPLDGSTIPATS